jgi:hypothetical protein
MAQVLLAIGGAIFLALGTLHGVLTLQDVAAPRAFTPTDETVRIAMQGARLAFNPRANLWQAWLGFNVSHSLGIVLFGGGLLLLAWLHFPVFAASRLLQGVAVVVAAAYLVLSLRFWFWVQLLGLVFRSYAFWPQWCCHNVSA